MTTLGHGVSFFIAICVENCNRGCSNRMIRIFNKSFSSFIVLSAHLFACVFLRTTMYYHTKLSRQKEATLRALENKLVQEIKIGQIFLDKYTGQ